VIQAPHSTSLTAVLALKANARAGLPTPTMRGWTEISWSNEGIEYWRSGDRLFLPPSEEEGGEWRELLSPRQRIPASEEEDEWRKLPLPSQPKRRQRKPSIKRMIAAAEQGGKTVTSITTPDGVTLRFGESEPTEANNPWLVGIDDKVTKQ
jgi:hypothetical protein